MHNQVTVHLGLWALAFVMLGTLAMTSVDVAPTTLAAAGPKTADSVAVLRHQKVAMQDADGRLTVYRTALAHGYR